jgi:hypothetical protein
VKINTVEFNNTLISIVESDNIIINNVQDAIDLLGNCSYQGSRKIVLKQVNIVPAFFDLKTGIAGEILQKFSNYRVQLAIVGAFSHYTSKSLRDFIRESNKQKHINFVNSRQEAIEKLTVNSSTIIQ